MKAIIKKMLAMISILMMFCCANAEHVIKNDPIITCESISNRTKYYSNPISDSLSCQGIRSDISKHSEFVITNLNQINTKLNNQLIWIKILCAILIIALTILTYLLILILKNLSELRNRNSKEELCSIFRKLAQISDKLKDANLKPKVIEEASVLTTSVASHVSKQMYDDAICMFINLNNRLFNLRKKENRTYLVSLIKRLCLQEEFNRGKIAKTVNESELSDTIKTDIIMLYDDIESFIVRRKADIDNFLIQNKLNLKYETCVRAPYGEYYNNEKDKNILEDDLLPETIVSGVLKVGYSFPNSTVAPYMEKCIIF